MVNDTHGHLMGSKLLSEIGEAIKEKCRLIDLAFRYGGDEFVVLLPQTSKENAMGVARRLHKLIRESRVAEGAGINVHLTASVGVASYPTRFAHQGGTAAPGRRGDVYGEEYDARQRGGLRGERSTGQESRSVSLPDGNCVFDAGVQVCSENAAAE